MEGLLSGIEGAVALVGTGEKNYLTLELSVTGTPGHSSTPPKNTAIGILARAVARLEASPLPAHMDAARMLFQGAGTKVSFVQRVALANLWLLGGIVSRVMERSPEANAMIRTTTAVTMISGGVKDNILPREAKAMVNFRLLPRDSKEDVIAHARRAIDDERVQIREPRSFDSRAAPLSPTTAPAFDQLSRVIRQTLGDIPVAPYLVIGATDARFYSAICDNVYRFSPLRMTAADLRRVHGIDECIAVADLAGMVRFFVRLIEVWAEK
jgi:carboxypeptidase PM20D1